MKAIFFTLVRAFEFELAVPTEELVNAPVAMLRPTLKNAPGQDRQMPLLVRPYRRT